MKDLVYYNELFEIYASLLTDKEKDAFKDYFYEDLSLSEIAENKEVSRAAVSKMVNNVIDKLKYYESILHKHEMIEKIKNTLDKNNVDEIKKEINKIIEM